MRLLVLYGPPAAGKLTVGKEVARLTGFKLFPNHLTFDLYEAVFEPGTDPFRTLVEETRLRVFEEACKQQIPGVIFTLMYVRGRDERFIGKMVEVVEKYGGEVLFVQIFCQDEELKKRVVTEERKKSCKMSSVRVLQMHLERYDLFSSIPDQKRLIW
jgi:hypothetical protein